MATHVFNSDCSRAAAALRQHIDSRRPTFSNVAKQPSWRRAQLAYLFDWYLNIKRAGGPAAYRSLFCNSGGEAVSATIKLARRGRGQRPPSCLVLDPTRVLRRLFNPLDAAPGRELVPGLIYCDSVSHATDRLAAQADCLFLVRLTPLDDPALMARLVDKCRQNACLVAFDLSGLALGVHTDRFVGLDGDIFVFGENTTEYEAPFGAVVAKRPVLRPWTRPRGMGQHLSTYGGNDFVVGLCIDRLTAALPLTDIARDNLNRIGHSSRDAFAAKVRWLNPTAARWGRALGLDGPILWADGHRLRWGSGQDVLDLVGGSGCSIRGHSPPALSTTLANWERGRDYWSEFSEALHQATGMGAALPAVSGATANEIALTLALSAARPRRHVVVFNATFAGRTMATHALSTPLDHNRHLYGPLYDAVTEIDTQAPDAAETLERTLRHDDVAVVWVQLIMYGSLKRFPVALLEVINREREKRGFLVVVDEIKTGLFRTGPLLTSTALLRQVDVVTLSKGLSDMSFPVAAVLPSRQIVQTVECNDPGLIAFFSSQYRNALGACVAAQAARWAINSNLQFYVDRVSGHLWHRLRRLAAAYPTILKDVQGTGLSVWFTFRSRGLLNGLSISHRMLKEHAVWMDSYEMNFPLTISESEIDIAMDALESVLRKPGSLPWRIRLHLAWAVLWGELVD